MTWRKLINDEKETIFSSTANSSKAIGRDLHIVIEKMILERENDQSHESDALLFSIAATNGYIQLFWMDKTREKFLGDYSYTLEIKTFWEKNIENSFDFDRGCFLGIRSVAKKIWLENKYRAFYRTELSAAKYVSTV
jgi:hypothetical protein